MCVRGLEEPPAHWTYMEQWLWRSNRYAAEWEYRSWFPDYPFDPGEAEYKSWLVPRETHG